MSEDNDNSGAFLTLFHNNKNQIYSFALKILGDEHAAGDVTQEVFLRLFKKHKTISKIENPENWLFIIARNLCLNQLRDRRKEISLSDIDENRASETYCSDSRYIVLEKAMYSLDTRFREALILKEYQGFSYKEIAEILQVTVTTVRSLLFNARTRLKDNFHKINNGRLIK